MTAETFLNGRVTLHCGDCLDVLAGMAEDSVESSVMDPPYHLHSIVKRFGAKGAVPAKRGRTGAYKRATAGFMGKQWDGGDIAFRPETWRAVWRVLKPGAYLIAFSSSRTFGRMSVAIEDAGFINHPLIGWIFGSGFPKAHRIKAEGWEGWRYGGQALKPALEPIYVGQKPFSEKTGTANVERWGCGALNIDACRVPVSKVDARDVGRQITRNVRNGDDWRMNCEVAQSGVTVVQAEGRWPANVAHDGSADVIASFPNTAGQQGRASTNPNSPRTRNVYGQIDRVDAPADVRGDAGSAARFFYSAKADIDDRLGSKHPTVKPLDLMQWLVRLVTPPGGVVLDPFAGTGTTGEAAFREGMRAVLIEREPEYQADIRRRMALVLAGPDERRRESVKARGPAAGAGPLFAEAAE